MNFRSQIPSAHKKFCCCDCGASFHHMHLLTNHIQSVHVDDPDKENEDENASKKETEILGDVDPTRTGEVATLEKPFQCEHCDKCFGVRIGFFFKKDFLTVTALSKALRSYVGLTIHVILCMTSLFVLIF